METVEERESSPNSPIPPARKTTTSRRRGRPPPISLGSKSRKEYLVLTCGPPSLSSAVPRGGYDDEESGSNDESSGDDENQTVSISDRHRPGKKQKTGKKNVKDKGWILREKQRRRRKGYAVPQDTKYTARKRKTQF